MKLNDMFRLIFKTDNTGLDKKNKKNVIKGYRKMAKLNKELSKEGDYVFFEALNLQEARLSECEECDGKEGRYLLR
jgi:hypothetical protein